MRFKNTIVTLTRIAGLFPVLEEHGNELIAKVETASKEEKRGDLKVLLQGLLAVLHKHQKGWTSNMKGEKLAPPKPTTVKSAPTAKVADVGEGAKGSAQVPQGPSQAFKGTKVPPKASSPSPALSDTPLKSSNKQASVLRPGAGLPEKPGTSERSEANQRSEVTRSQVMSQSSRDHQQRSKVSSNDAPNKYPDSRQDGSRDKSEHRTSRPDSAEAARELALASMRNGRGDLEREPSRAASAAEEVSESGHRISRKRPSTPSLPLPASKHQERESLSGRNHAAPSDHRLTATTADDDKESRPGRGNDRIAARSADETVRGTRDTSSSSTPQSERQERPGRSERLERADRADRANRADRSDRLDRSSREGEEPQTLDQREAYREALLARRSRDRGRDKESGSRPSSSGSDLRDANKDGAHSIMHRIERRGGRSATGNDSSSRASSPSSRHRDRERSSGGKGSIRGVIEAALDMPPRAESPPSSGRKRARDRDEPAVEERREDDSQKRIKLDSPRGPLTSVKIRGRGSGIAVPPSPHDQNREPGREESREQTREKARDSDRSIRGQADQRSQAREHERERDQKDAERGPNDRERDVKDREREQKDREREQKVRDRERELRRRGMHGTHKRDGREERPPKASYGAELASAAAAAASTSKEQPKDGAGKEGGGDARQAAAPAGRAVEGPARWPDREGRGGPASAPASASASASAPSSRNERHDRVLDRRRPIREARDSPRESAATGAGDRDRPAVARDAPARDAPAREPTQSRADGREHGRDDRHHFRDRNRSKKRRDRGRHD